MRHVQEASAACDRAKRLAEAALVSDQPSRGLPQRQCIRTLQGIADVQAAAGNTAEATEILSSMLGDGARYPLTARDRKRAQRCLDSLCEGQEQPAEALA